MNRNGTSLWRGGLFIALALVLAACSHGVTDDASDEARINAYPENYKADILAAMHAYLNDPTGIRDAAIAAPALKSASMSMPSRYVACLRFNPKKSATSYAGVREIAAVFLAGRFDQFIDNPKDLCAGATYAPFPELQQLAQ